MNPVSAMGKKGIRHGRPHCLVCAVVMMACCAALGAQQEVSTQRNVATAQKPANANSFELERQNSERVAASTQQIREVLVKDPGLLVELKRWVSKEATSNGQIVADEDLTDQAIFERLEEDVIFRSVATRLVQRYGYLLPGVNPDSDLGKQQELVLKERARRLVQIEEQEDADSLRGTRDEQSPDSVQRAKTCDPSSEMDCTRNAPQRQRHQQNSGPRNSPAPYGNAPEGVPLPNEDATGSAILRARNSAGPAESATGTSDDPTNSLLLAALFSSPEVRDTRGSIADMTSRREGLRTEGADPDMDSARIASLSLPASPLRKSSEYAASSKPTSLSLDSRRESSPDTLLHKHNPYADIPSLYDLYVQVPASGRTAERFGIDILSGGLREPDAIPMDLPVGPDYTVGPGDSLAIDLWGGVSQRMLRVVDRQGRIALPEAGPLLVSGKTLGEVQSTVQEVLRSQYRDVSADVSLSRLRTIRVYVVGEVGEPGAYDISSLSTPLNAIVAAGGVTPRGSLRSLKHFRGKQLIEVVDAYDLLLRGVSTDEKRLESGDSLLVPPAGPQVTIEGMVRRPAIYEMRGETTLEDALELAGGILPAAQLQHVEVERLVAHQKRTMFSVDLSSSEDADAATTKLNGFQVQDGDRIHIFPIAPYNDQAIYLQGHVLRPGRYSYKKGMKLSDLVSSYGDLLPEPAGNYAEIIRLNPPDYRPTVESFDLAAALAKPESSPKLQPLDTVRIFSKFDFQAAPDVWVGGEVREPGLYVTSGQARLRDAVYLAGGVSPDAELDSAQLFRTSKDGTLKILSVNLSGALAGNPTSNLLLEPHDRIIVHRNPAKVDPPTVYVKGQVAKPGRYPLTSNMRVQDLILAAGGLKRSADSQNAVLAHEQQDTSGGPAATSVAVKLSAMMTGDSTANLPLNNGDVLTIRQLPGWDNLGAKVTIRGEVMHPGTYGIEPGESLATVLGEAGGFTSEANPYGTVLTRRDVRDLEMKTHDELLARVKSEETQLKALPENDVDQKNAKLTALAQVETALTQLETNLPIGRVVIHASPDLKTFEQAAANAPLRNGDVIVVPKKADYVLVNGQVFNATAVGYVPGRSAKWYLGQAGGLTQLADKKSVFVIRANGSVLTAKNNSTIWSGDPLSAVLLPGDAIIVPERALKVGTRNWGPLLQSAQVATSAVLAVAYLKP